MDTTVSSRSGAVRPLLLDLFMAAVSEAQPAHFMTRHIPARPDGRLVVVGAGKAAASMAAAFEDGYEGELTGLVVTRYGYRVPTRRIDVMEASHPVPDAASFEASARMLERVEGLSPNDLVVALISGGGSALLCAPTNGVSREEKQLLNQMLLKSGAPIHAMNCIRKHLSRIKGGRLAKAAYPARLLSLLMSDIPGDDISAIASGPTVADETTLADARAYVEQYGIALPASMLAALDDSANETPKPGDPCFRRAANQLVMTPGMALDQVATLARRSGFEIVHLGDDLEGEASALGAEHARLARSVAASGKRTCILSGGETTVTPKEKSMKMGRGGRNTEYLLSFALELGGVEGIHALAGDTDGVDGSEDNAGAIATPDTLARARQAGIDLHRHLEQHDAYSAFEHLGDLVVTGPTMTNVNDCRIILVDP